MPVNNTQKDCGEDTRSVFNRRKFLSIASFISAGVLSGCSGSDGGGSEGGGSEGDGSDGGISEPWTLDELAKKAKDEGGKISIYNSLRPSPHEPLVKIINEKYPFLEADVFTGSGTEVAQRAIQESQAGELNTDIFAGVGDIFAQPNLKEDLIAPNHDSSFAIVDELPSKIVNPYFIGVTFWGPQVAMVYNSDEIVKSNLPQSWNDLFKDEFKDTDFILSSDPNLARFGWVLDHHSTKQDMDPIEWLSELNDHVNFKLSEGYVPGNKKLVSGQVAPFMFDNYPWVTRFVGDPGRNVYMDDMPVLERSGAFSVAKSPSNPWTARFYLAASVQPWAQKGMIKNDLVVNPGRFDLDYSDLDLAEWRKKEMSADWQYVTDEEVRRLQQITPKVFEEVLDIDIAGG